MSTIAQLEILQTLCMKPYALNRLCQKLSGSGYTICYTYMLRTRHWNVYFIYNWLDFVTFDRMRVCYYTSELLHRAYVRTMRDVHIYIRHCRKVLPRNECLSMCVCAHVFANVSIKQNKNNTSKWSLSRTHGWWSAARRRSSLALHKRCSPK